VVQAHALRGEPLQQEISERIAFNIPVPAPVLGAELKAELLWQRLLKPYLLLR
jgi:hypothetical protein